MAKVLAYHRPSALDEALAILAEPGTPKVLLGGGTVVNASSDRTEIEVVDLQALGLDSITSSDGRMSVGAGVTLQELCDHEETPAAMAVLARREAPSTLRTMATVGGLVVHADPESELLAAFLVHGASVSLVSANGSVTRDLSEVLAGGVAGSIVTDVSFDSGGTTAVERTARTPADRAICAVVGRKSLEGVVRLAVCGAASTPVFFDDSSMLSPAADFRGSSEYRLHLIEVLASRVREALA